MSPDNLALHMEDLTVAFNVSGSIQPVLKAVNLEIRAGEWVGIVGKNGSGKSTLARAISGACPISRGSLRIGTAQTVQMVFQNPDAQIVGETVFEEVCFGMENQALDPAIMRGRMQKALCQVGLSVPLDRSTNTLSGGQKQLLNIASCLAVDATVLVFDEATSMLDPMARRRILEIVHHLHKNGLTVIWITQWLEELAFAKRVVALEDGRVAFNGCCQQFFYPETGQPAASPCEQLGFALPYAVQVAKRLLTAGYALEPLPLSVEDLSQAVTSLWPLS